MDRRRSLNRRGATRNPKPRTIIVCEGRLTEPDYFKALARSSGALVSFERAAGVPLSVVNNAIDTLKRTKRASSFSRFDTVWAVFDRDEHPNFEEAINVARQSDVRAVFSNPCFELWLVIHCCDWDRPIDRHSIQRELRRLIPSFDPDGAKRVDFRLLSDKVAAAINRAKLMERRRIEERSDHGNPITTVYRLVEHLLPST